MKKYDEESLKVKNVCDLAQKDASSFWTEFFDPTQQKKLASALFKQGVEHSFFGGHEDAERKILFVKASWDELEESAPLVLLQMDVPGKTTHRDVLGSLLSTGIKRDQVGDILVSSGKAYVFVLENMANYIRTNVEHIRNQQANVTICSMEDVELPKPEFKIEHCVLTSFRLDNVVAKACKMSRSAAGELVSKGLVKVDHEVADKGTHNVSDGTLVSVRGYGRFIFRSLEGSTRKGNQKAEIHWYK